LGRTSRYFTELTDSDLFEQILGGYAGLTPKVEPTTITYPEIVQYQVSDWDLIVSRAEKVGPYCLAEGGTFRIAKPDLDQAAALDLTYGVDVFDLDLEMDARTQPKKVTASAWDPAVQEVITADVDDAPAPAQGNLSGPDLADVSGLETLELRHSGTLQQPEIDAWAEARMARSRFARIRGTVRLQGNEALRPGVLVELEGMGDRFNGTAFVSGVRHLLGDGDWESIVQIGLPPAWHAETHAIDAPAASGFHPAVAGLQVGVVTQLQDDPDGADRILVRLPLISDADPGVWSRLATLDAGDKRGSVFRPEIGDEVVVGFVNADPHEPVVLGMLHSGAKPAPLAASDDNHEKGLVTRSGMKVVFNDDTPSLTVETPAGNTIVIAGPPTLSFSTDLFKSADYSALLEIWEKVAAVAKGPTTIIESGKEAPVPSLDALHRIALDRSKDGASFQRYKGLGEMNPEQLWETTMNPDTRTLLRVTMEDAVGADEMFTVLMGDAVEPRREFIEKNALDVVNLDV
jgi:Rhs element Vgr protein